MTKDFRHSNSFSTSALLKNPAQKDCSALMALLWGPTWYPFVSYIKNQFFNQFNGTHPKLYGHNKLSSVTSVTFFHPVLKYIWEISETSVSFLDIKVSINCNGQSNSAHFKPTLSHSLHSSSHPSHVKNYIMFSQFLRLRRLWLWWLRSSQQINRNVLIL